MKLRQLQCFCAVVDAGFNISQAARVVHATQPAVSRQLRQFEEELGVDLLVRQAGRPVGLTEVGVRNLAWARRALQCADNIRLASREGREGAGIITIATSHTHANHVLLPAILGFQRRFPTARFNVLQGTPNQVAELVKDSRAAFGVTHQLDDLSGELVAAPFLTSPRLLVTPSGHVLHKQKQLTLEKIAAHPIILPQSTRPQGARIARKFEQAGVQAHVVMWALDADVIKTYVAAGLGIGLVPGFTFAPRKDRGLRARDVTHLFGPSESAVLLRRHSHLQKYIYRFIAGLDPALDADRLESLVMEQSSPGASV